MSVIEKFAQSVANDIEPQGAAVVAPGAEIPQRAINWGSIVTIVITLVTEMFQDCQAGLGTITNMVRNPSRKQQAYLLKKVRSATPGLLPKLFAGRIYEHMLSRAATLEDSAISDAYDEAQDDVNLLI